MSLAGGCLRACLRPDPGASPLIAHLERIGPRRPILLDLRASLAAPGAVERLQEAVAGWPGELAACSFDHRLVARLDPVRGPARGFGSWLVDPGAPRHLRLIEAASRRGGPLGRGRPRGRLAVQFALYPGSAPRPVTLDALARAGVGLVVGNIDRLRALPALADPRISGALTDSPALFGPGRSIPVAPEYT